MDFVKNISRQLHLRVDAFSGLTAITFIQHTINNYEFAEFFQLYVIKKIKPETLIQKIRVYWGHSDKRAATKGTLLDDSDLLKI